VGVGVPHNKEGKPKIRKKNFWGDGVNPVVNSVGGVRIDNPEGVETGAKKRLIRGDVEGKDIINPLKPGEHRVVAKKSIPAPKAVMLNDGKKGGGRGRPLTQGRRHGLIIDYRDEPDNREGLGRRTAPPGGEDH